jgi:hypothetical protein
MQATQATQATQAMQAMQAMQAQSACQRFLARRSAREVKDE